MEYKHIMPGRFLERPNRFIAKVEIGDVEGECCREGEATYDAGQERERKPDRIENAHAQEQKKNLKMENAHAQERKNPETETVHVKNTGRCRELLQRGARVYLERSDNPVRRTAYDLVAVEKGTRLINMDSQAPNKAAEEWLRSGALLPDIRLVQPEFRYGNSRFDFYMETASERIFMEVKGVTLEEDGVVLFPDAPSDRAVKHVEELILARHAGYRCFVLFVIQMENVKYFMPNRRTHPEFAEALRRAEQAGVEILACDCLVTPESMRINRSVPIILSPEEEGILGKGNESRK